MSQGELIGLAIEHQLGLRDDAFDVHRCLFHFGSHKAARCQDEIRVCFAVAVLQVEPPEEDARCFDGRLSHLQPLAQLLNQVGEPDAEAVELMRRRILQIDGSGFGQLRPGGEPVPAMRRRPEIGRHGWVLSIVRTIGVTKHVAERM